MPLRLVLMAFVFTACGTVGAGQAVPAAAAAPGKGAAWPKGSYAALDKLPDWGGVWVPGRSPSPPLQLKGEYRTKYEAWVKATSANNGEAVRETSNCMPPGMPRMMGTAQYPIEFLFTPGRVTTLHEAWMQSRTIFTDGRGHPDDWDGGIFGHSIGHWEGQTLVVDTIGIKTITALATGMKHSDKLHITERFALKAGDPDTLTVETTMEDPLALEKPSTSTYTFKRQRDWNLLEFVCAENDRNPVDAEGRTGFQ
ncbi:MAG: hypothetical protein ABIP18_11430 [Steroidobacteraceae bacterium]